MLRSICSIVFFFKGLLFSTPDSLKSPIDLIRLWNHECNRVYRDKLLDDKDLEQFDKIQVDFNRKFFEVRSNFSKFHLLTILTSSSYYFCKTHEDISFSPLSGDIFQIQICFDSSTHVAHVILY